MKREGAVTGARYMVAAGHHLAAQAAFEILEGGGNAVDAGVAANLALAVLQSDQVNVAGVAPMLVHRARERETLAVAGLGPWPKAARLEIFVDEHAGDIPPGILRTVVPAAPDANIQALERFGTASFAEVAAAAIRFARDGFAMHRLMSHYIETYEERYRRWPENASIYLPNGRPPKPGELFVQSDLAATLQYMADEEAAAAPAGRRAGLRAAHAAFYRGDIAAAIVRYHRENGGLLEAGDLAAYRSTVETPVRRTVTCLGEPAEVYTCGPWCQGPVLLEMLAILEGFDLESLGHNSADYLHVLAEVMKLAFADRERYFGDPRFVDVPLGRLLGADYAAQRRRLVRPDEAWPEMPPAGDAHEDAPRVAHREAGAAERAPPPGDTSFVCVIDAEGNVFCCNPSDVTWDSPVIPGTGLCPSARGSQSWAVPGHPSALAPGKRPRLTPSPVLFARPGERIMPIGTPGGDIQPQAVLQVLLNAERFRMDPQEAVEAPRIVTYSHPDSFSPHTAYPGRITLEDRIDAATRDSLAARGHRVERLEPLTWATGGVCLAAKDARTGTLWGAADPRRPSRAIGW